jgi:hypothetical protein
MFWFWLFGDFLWVEWVWVLEVFLEGLKDLFLWIF